MGHHPGLSRWAHVKCHVSLEEEGRERSDSFRRGGGNVTKELRAGGMQSQAKEQRLPPEAGTSKEQISLTAFGGHEAPATL